MNVNIVRANNIDTMDTKIQKQTQTNSDITKYGGDLHYISSIINKDINNAYYIKVSAAKIKLARLLYPIFNKSSILNLDNEIEKIISLIYSSNSELKHSTIEYIIKNQIFIIGFQISLINDIDFGHYITGLSNDISHIADILLL